MCQRITETINVRTVNFKNKRLMKRGQFVICCSIETQFVKDDSIGGSYLNSTIYKLPFELHLPGYKFTGSGTKPEKN